MKLSEIDNICKHLHKKSVNEILDWIFSQYGDDVGFMTALGSSGIVLLSHIRKIKPNINPYFIDTGFHFKETIDLLIKLEKDWKIKFRILKQALSEADFKKYTGEKPWEVNPDICCHFRKVDPLLRVLHTKKAWISALRRDQSQTRSQLDVIEIDGRGTTKLYPLVNWNYKKVWKYIREKKLPYNVLHDKGYPSIGCYHCTLPVRDGDNERSGRWNSMLKLECGIHVNVNNNK